MGVRANIPIINFSSGELSDEMQARIDLAKYSNGCRILLNWIPLIEGGITRRPGTRFVAPAKYGDRVCRLIPFTFSTLQAYMIEVGHGYMRFYKDNGQIQTAGTAVEIFSPYQEEDLPGIKYAQDADTLYLVHPSYPPKKLTRTSHTAWALEDVPFADGPFLDPNTDDTWKITAAGGQLIVNGTFAVGTTGWGNFSTGTGTFTVSGGSAQLVNGTAGNVGSMETSFPTLTNVVYTVSFDVATTAVTAMVGTASGLQDVLASASYAVGTGKTFTFTAKNSATYIRFSGGVASSTSLVDNVSCVKPLHTGAAVNLTANQNTWLESHVGAYWKISDATGGMANPQWSAALGVVIGGRIVYNGNVYEATNTGTTGTRPPVHLRGNVSDGGVNWTFINDGAGYVQITNYLSPTSATGTVKQHLPSNSSTGTSYWAEGVWSPAKGYPRAVTFMEQRLSFSGASGNPARIDQSQSGQFEGFKSGTTADRAVSFTLGTGEVNAVMWLLSGTGWFAGTNGSTFSLTTSNDTPIKPDNLPRSSEIDTFGSADLQPLKVAGNVLYVQRGGKRVRELSYKFESQGFVPIDRTVLARHITSDSATIKEWCYEQDPNSTIWAIRTDGTLLGFTYFPEQDIFAWSRHTTEGSFESVACIPTATSDQTWAAVHRVIDGADVRYIEYFDKELNTDCALTYIGDAVTSITAASVSHLYGKTAQIIANGGVMPAQVIGSADVTLGTDAVYVEMGLRYDSDCETVRPEIRTQEGSTQGMLKRFSKLTARVVSTNALTINGQFVTTRAPNDYLDTGPAYVTGDLKVGVFGSTTTGTIRIQQLEPLPARVLGVFATLDASDL